MAAASASLGPRAALAISSTDIIRFLAELIRCTSADAVSERSSSPRSRTHSFTSASRSSSS
jgi:hypothetical protein